MEHFKNLPRQKNGRLGDWIQTYTGIQFYVFDPRPEDIVIEDIAHATSNICRWVGHCKEYFSVAQHQVLVGDIASVLAPKELKLCAKKVGYLHDAHEAYKGDMATPTKRCLPEIAVLEDQLDTVIFPALGITLDEVESVKEYVERADRILLATEKYQLTNQKTWHAWDTVEQPWPDLIIKALPPKEAYDYYSKALIDVGLMKTPF